MNRFIGYARCNWMHLLAIAWMLVAFWNYATEDYPRAAWFGFLALIMLICAISKELAEAHGRSYDLQIKQLRMNARRQAELEKRLLDSIKRLDSRP